MAKCPHCEKDIEHSYTVQTSDMEPFTSVYQDKMNALSAWGGWGGQRIIICQTDDHVHFSFDHDGREHLVKMVIYDPGAIGRAWEANEQVEKTCEHDGCYVDGDPVYFNPTDTEPAYYYCHDHMYPNGFCPGCILFYAGWESFDFSMTGMCEACSEMYYGEVDEYDGPF
jgi:hypothetical protein